MIRTSLDPIDLRDLQMVQGFAGGEDSVITLGEIRRREYLLKRRTGKIRVIDWSSLVRVEA